MIERLINQRLTRVEAADPKSYQPCDVVVFHRDAYGCAAHDICTVAEIGELLSGAEGLDDGQRRMIADWQKADRLQGELIARIESLPGEAAALVERAGDGFPSIYSEQKIGVRGFSLPLGAKTRIVSHPSADTKRPSRLPLNLA